MIIFYLFCYDLPDVFHALKNSFRIFIISVGSWLHPSLVAGEDHTECALEGSNLAVKAMLISIKDSDSTLTELLVGRVCINNMSIQCIVGIYFGLLKPDVAFNRITDFGTDYASGNYTYAGKNSRNKHL